MPRGHSSTGFYVVMNNHWHFVVWPKRGQGEQVSDFFRWLTTTHAQRWHAHHGTAGMGHVYQGRFKSFPVASDEHLLTRAALRRTQSAAGRAGEACEDYRWSSLHRRLSGAADPEAPAIPLAEPPLPLGRKWIEHVNRPQTEVDCKPSPKASAAADPTAAPGSTKSPSSCTWNPPSAPAEDRRNRSTRESQQKRFASSRPLLFHLWRGCSRSVRTTIYPMI